MRDSAAPYAGIVGPTNFIAHLVGDDQILLTWTNNSSLSDKPYYGIYLSRQVDGGTWRLVSNGIEAYAVQYVDYDIEPGHRYRYRISAFNTYGESSAEYSDYIDTAPPAPSAPSSVEVERVSDATHRVKWSNPSWRIESASVERSADDGGWVQLATIGGFASNYTDNGTTPNRRYRYRVRVSADGQWSDYSYSAYSYTTPAPPSSVRAASIGSGRVRVSAEGIARWATSHEVQHKGPEGSWGDSSIVDSLPAEMRVELGDNIYRVRSGRDGMWSDWCESEPVSTVSIPLAPTVSAPPAVYESGSTVVLSWTPNHPDGSAQVKAEVEVAKPDGGTSTVVVDGAESRSEILLDARGLWKFRVRTHGVHASWGQWSGQVETLSAVAPVVTVTAPAIDGEEVASVPLTVAWDVEDETGVSSQTVRLVSADGSPLHEARLDGSARSYELRAGTYLPENLASYTIEVSVRGGSSLSATARRSFTVSFAEPATPFAEFAQTPELAAEVSVRYGADDWALDGWTWVSPEYTVEQDGIPVTSGLTVDEDGAIRFGAVVPTEYVTVIRVTRDGSQWMAADRVNDGETARDPLPPLGTDYKYLVTAYSATGTASTLELPAHVEADAIAINYGPAAVGFVPLRCDVEWSRSYELSTTLMDFADGGESGGLPTAYTTGAAKVTGSIDATVLGRSEQDALDAMARRHAVAWVRDHLGRRALCSIGLGMTGSTPRDVAGVSISLTECAWREAWDG